MNLPNPISDTDTTPEQHQVVPGGRRKGERPEERREGERRDVEDAEHDPDFARGDDRRQLS
jgi:hypothetical protein